MQKGEISNRPLPSWRGRDEVDPALGYAIPPRGGRLETAYDVTSRDWAYVFGLPSPGNIVLASGGGLGFHMSCTLPSISDATPLPM